MLGKATAFCEGTRGPCTKQLVKKLGLDDGKNPQAYATGVKEVWEFEKSPLPDGHIIHTMGYPMDSKTFGGSFIYAMTGNPIAVGVITGLDYQEPTIEDDPRGRLLFDAEDLHGRRAHLRRERRLDQTGPRSTTRLAHRHARWLVGSPEWS